MRNALDLPAGLPVPQDDGACDHLPGTRIPEVWLASTDGFPVNLSRIGGRTVLYCYPRTGKPDQPIPDGWDAIPGENDRTPMLRALAINLLGTVGADAEVRAEAARRFDDSPVGGGSGAPIPPDIESATLAVVSQLLRPGDYDALLERYRSASTPQEEMRSLGALAGFPDVDLCLRTFDLAMTEVRSQNGFAVLGQLLANSVGNQAVWTRLTETWDAVLNRFPKNAPPRIIEAIPALCGDAAFAEKAIGFLKDNPLSSGPRRVAQSVERLRVNVAFGSRERDGLVESLRAAGARTS